MIVLLEGLWDAALSQYLKLVMDVAELGDKKKMAPIEQLIALKGPIYGHILPTINEVCLSERFLVFAVTGLTKQNSMSSSPTCSTWCSASEQLTSL